jgi:hypothetical protein
VCARLAIAEDDKELSPKGHGAVHELLDCEGKLTTGELHTCTCLPAAKMLMQMLCGLVP